MTSKDLLQYQKLPNNYKNIVKPDSTVSLNAIDDMYAYGGSLEIVSDGSNGVLF